MRRLGAGVMVPPNMNHIANLVDQFTTQLAALTEQRALELARASLASALGGRKRGLPTSSLHLAGTLSGRQRKKQLCPVPGCKNPAAPIFGMVCAAHKSVPKAKIKKYRQARRAAKLGTKTKRGSARPKRMRPTPPRKHRKVVKSRLRKPSLKQPRTRAKHSKMIPARTAAKDTQPAVVSLSTPAAAA